MQRRRRQPRAEDDRHATMAILVPKTVATTLPMFCKRDVCKRDGAQRGFGYGGYPCS